MTHAIEAPYYSYSSALPRTVRARRETILTTRTLSGMLLAAVVSALLVVLDQVLDIQADEHMLGAWMVLWTVTFAVVVVLAHPLRKVSSTVLAWFSATLAERKARRMEAQLWEYAHHDPRIMAELQHAWLRSYGQI